MQKCVYFIFCFAVLYSEGQCQTTQSSSTNITTVEEQLEDSKIINESISTYGSPQDYKLLGLPGSELATDNDQKLYTNKLASNGTGNYIIRIRTVTEYFNYNGRYEIGHILKNHTEETPKIKGQFGEHFVRKSGGFYIRSVGYILDQNGYREFLIDLSTAKITFKEIEVGVNAGETVGGPDGIKSQISSTVLGTLIGGNSIG